MVPHKSHLNDKGFDIGETILNFDESASVVGSKNDSIHADCDGLYRLLFPVFSFYSTNISPGFIAAPFRVNSLTIFVRSVSSLTCW